MVFLKEGLEHFGGRLLGILKRMAQSSSFIAFPSRAPCIIRISVVALLVLMLAAEVAKKVNYFSKRAEKQIISHIVQLIYS